MMELTLQLTTMDGLDLAIALGAGAGAGDILATTVGTTQDGEATITHTGADITDTLTTVTPTTIGEDTTDIMVTTTIGIIIITEVAQGFNLDFDLGILLHSKEVPTE